MRNKYTLTLAAVTTLIFTACGGGGGTDGTSGSLGSTSMNQGTAYAVNAGDSIVKSSDPTVVLIETDIQSGASTITLQGGSATIER